MERLILIMAAALGIAAALMTNVLTGCSSTSVKQEAENSPKVGATTLTSFPVSVLTTTETASTVSISKINKTIERLRKEISEIQKLEEQVYAKSIKGNSLLKKKLEQKIDKIGSVETLQANIRVLEELRTNPTGN